MKKLALMLIGCCCVAATFAQREKVQLYIDTYKEVAIAEMLRSGVPASITLAQGILESQSGESDLCKRSNNHFGIKCKETWTGEKTYHDDDEKGECFRVYPSAMDSYKDHSDFLKTRPYYAFLFKLDPTDYEGWAKGLKKAGYATAPTYPQQLLKLINDYNLQQYTLLALQRQQQPQDSYASANNETQASAPVIAAVTTKPQPAVVTNAVDSNTDKEEEAAEVFVQPAKTVVAATADNKKPGTTYPEGVFTINHTKVIYAKEGTSMLSLANQYSISLSKLLEFNDMDEMDILDTDRLLFIEKKMKKGASDVHVVEDGETLHSICQTEGIRMESLIEYNKLKKDAKVSKGEKLYLRALPPVTAPKDAKQGTTAKTNTTK